MLNLKKVAITGGLSSGKSSVCQIFRNLGSYVVSADEIVHQLLSSDSITRKQVVTLLGSDIYDNFGNIDRKKIANKVFNNTNLLKSLEKIIHPKVAYEIDIQYQKACEGAEKKELFIAEVPLLFESEFFKESLKKFEAIIVVVATKEKSLERFIKSSGFGKDEYEKRLTFQMPQEEKVKRAHFVIYNNKSLKELHQTVVSIHNQLTTIS